MTKIYNANANKSPKTKVSFPNFYITNVQLGSCLPHAPI